MNDGIGIGTQKLNSAVGHGNILPAPYPDIVHPPDAADVAVSPTVPSPSERPAGFETIHNKPAKRWYVGTLVYTTAGLLLLFFWLLFGDFALSLRDRSVGPVVQLMLRGFGTNNFLMSVLLSVIPTGIAMVLSPIVSYKSDRLRSRWGRRIPFLLIPTPVAALAMVGMAFCPHIASGLQHLTGDAIGRTTALLMVFAVFWTCFEFAAIVAGSVMGGLINDVVPRPVLGRFFGLFRAVSLIDGMIFNWYVLGHAEEHFTLIFIWIAGVFGVGFTLMCLMVKEGTYPEPVTTHDDPRPVGFFVAASIYFRECFSRPYYLLLFGAFSLAVLAANPINSWSVMYAKQLKLGMGNWDTAGIGYGEYRLGYGGIMTLTFVCSLFLAYPLGSLVDRFHALRVATCAMLLYAISCSVSFILIHDSETFGWALLANGVLSGTYFTSAASMAQVLLPRARFSQFASAGAMVTQLVTLIYNPLLGAVLDWTGSNYRITFLLSGVFALTASITLFIVYRRFMALGGPNGYVAPLN